MGRRAVEDPGGLSDLVVIEGDADSGDGQARGVGQVDQLVWPGVSEAAAIGHQQPHVRLEPEPLLAQVGQRGQQWVGVLLLPGQPKRLGQGFTFLPGLLGQVVVRIVVDVPVTGGVLVRSLGDRCEQRGDVRADVVCCHEMHCTLLIAKNAIDSAS